MSKTVTINQDKLLMLKETMASDGNITSHNSYCSELTEAAPEVDEYEIGDEGSNPPVGGNFYHVNESTNFDTSEKSINKVLLSESKNSKRAHIQTRKIIAKELGLDIDDFKVIKTEQEFNKSVFGVENRGVDWFIVLEPLAWMWQKSTNGVDSIIPYLSYIYNKALSFNKPSEYITKIKEITDFEVLKKYIDTEIYNEKKGLRDKAKTISYNYNNNYKVLGPLSFREAKKYGNYSCPNGEICYTQSANIWRGSLYSDNGKNRFYLILKDGWKDVYPSHDGSEKNNGLEELQYDAYDNYGLSMIFLFVNPYGELHECNTRWNHNATYSPKRSVDYALNEVDISKIIGKNFYDVFKPVDNFSDLVNSAKEKILNGEKIEDVFDKLRKFNKGFSIVKIGGKYNYVNLENNIISDIWFDKCYRFRNGLAKVKLKHKFNFITSEGDILSKIWFDDVDDFVRGFSIVSLDGGYNHIRTDGTLVWPKPVDEWFCDCQNFVNGFSVVEDFMGGYNYLSTNGELLSDTSFDCCNDFENGMGLVWKNNKVNFIKPDKTFFTDKWYDDISEFVNGFYVVNNGGKYNYLTIQGKLLLNDWYDFLSYFDKNGYADGELNGIEYFIDKFGNVMPKNKIKESNNSNIQLVENKYDDLFNKTTYDLQNFINQCKEKYGDDGWYISSWMDRVHPEIKIDPKDIKIYNALSKKLSDVAKLWNEEEIKDETTDASNGMIEDYDIISLAIEQYGTTSNISQAGYILPDGRLLNFGNDGYRDVDHRAIGRIYKENNIPIWSDEYRYNYVVDFMNHGAIRCDVYSGILDMTQEPTNEQYSTIKTFVRRAVDIDIDFTDNKGNTLHSVSYSDAKPQQVVADIQRYYNEGIKPQGNVQYEGKKIKHTNLIIESQESKSIAAAKRLVMQRLNYNEQEADEFIRIKLRNDIPSLRTPQGGKFILGVTRMFCNGELRNANDIGNLNSTLKLVASDVHINEYDRNLNGMSCQELIQRFAKAMSDSLDAEKAEIGQMVFDTPSDYEIVRIDSFEQAEEYGDYVSWCVTHNINMFDSYTSDGINQFYFCLRNGFDGVEEVPSEGCPLDEYGLSMIAISVNENGMLSTCTCRWNHDNGGNDSIMNAKEVSQVIGMNFFEVFKPNNKWKDLLISVMQRLANGEDPRNVFDIVGDFSEGFAGVRLNRKWNFINQEGRFISDQWFDNVGVFREGFAWVVLNRKCNFINQEGRLISDQWFDNVDDFSEGFARVVLNDKRNFINQEGRLISDQWFDGVYFFSEGFAEVKLNGKWNFINQEGRLISDQWFDNVSYFSGGTARVRINGKWNYINQEGRFLSGQWFDNVSYFSGGTARVELNGKTYELDTSGNLALIESKNKNKKILISENQLEAIKENFDYEVSSSEIDLSSFKKKHELVPNIWNPDGKLNSRIRLKLLDIADDFWEYVNLTWVKPSGIILTGSICNFNWSQYSDIDLHLIVDFDEIDEKTEFVKDYLDSKKNEWNNEHGGLQIMGYPVELYVQNLGEMPESNGIYDLEENDWVREPNPDDIKSIGLNKFSIKDKAAKIMTIIDDMYDALASTDDSHKIEQMGNDANYLWKKVKEMRKNSLEKNGESGSGNIVYKILRRTGYLDRLFKLSNVVYDKFNSITESVKKGIIKEYLDNDYNLPLYRYFKWAKTASLEEKARSLAYSCSHFIKYYIERYQGSDERFEGFEAFLDEDGEFNYEDEEQIEKFVSCLVSRKLCDHFISEMQSIVDYYELPSWCTMDFNRVVKNEWCIHFGSDAMNIAREGFTGGTEDIDHLAYTGAGQEKHYEGYDFAFLISDKNVDYNEYGNEAVIFRTSGVEAYHYGDNQNQVIFWGPNAHDFIPIRYSGEQGDWIVEGQKGQILKSGKPSEIAVWATENLPQYRKQIMAGKNGYIPMMGRWNQETNRYERIPYPLYRNESIKKYITLLKEEVVADGSSEHNPYKKRWEAERKALKDFICNFGKVMTSKENGKTYKVYYDKTLSQLIGYNYCICLQWDAVNLKPKSVLYIRALDKFTDRMFQANFDARGRDNMAGTYDDLSYQAQ